MRHAKVTNQQIKKIHTLKRALGLDDETYRAALESGYGVTSSKALTQHEAGGLIAQWERQAVAAGAWVIQDKKKFAGPRPGAGASAAQLRLVQAMWRKVSKAAPHLQLAALDKFVRRITKRERLEWTTPGDIAKIVKALETMGARVGGEA